MTKIPIHSYEDLRKRANDFLRTYNPSGTIPVPIEEIVEFEFGINIVPVLGLQREFEIDGFTSSDLKNIFVDEFVYTDRINRYRFTLAHEIGHIVLHASVFKANQFDSISDWKEFTSSLPDGDHRWLEYQGYAFAGLVLVPRENLIKQTEKWIKKIKGEGVSLKANWDFAWELITAHLGKGFEVSSSVIEKRLEKDEIKKKYTK